MTLITKPSKQKNYICEMKEKVLVMGASMNPSRYSNIAANMLLDYGHELHQWGRRAGEIRGVPIQTELPDIDDLDTITLYLGPQNQPPFYDYIVNSGTKRVIFNPGTENEELMSMLTGKRNSLRGHLHFGLIEVRSIRLVNFCCTLSSFRWMIERIVILLVLISSSAIAQDQIEFKGVSFSMANRVTKTSDIVPIKKINANWVSIVPYAFIQDHEVIFDSEYQWVGERPEGIRKCIELAHDQGLKVLLKPHIWIGWGAYTGDFKCDSEKDWEAFEASYTDYIMTFVEIAKEEKVEMFSIGTEWRTCVSERPTYWKGLIKEIKNEYKGDLIYAANWDDYQKVPFWDQLDYIGIDAYFPLSEKANPSLDLLIRSWKSISPIIEQYANSQKKKVVFTEFGFQSRVGSTIKPWESNKEGKFSEKIQDLAFQAFFKTIWTKSWFMGGFVWKWYHGHSNAGGKGDKDFTPQNKKAEETIRRYFGD